LHCPSNSVCINGGGVARCEAVYGTPTPTPTPTPSNDNSDVIPESFDWRTKGAVNAIKNQGSCGSCWSFAIVSNIESLYFKKYGKLLTFAEQQLVDCDTTNYGCNGGSIELGFNYVKKNGLGSSTSYSYKAARGTCQYSSSNAVAKITSYVQETSKSETKIRDMLVAYGPLAVAMNATPLQYYSSGIFTSSCAGALNHAVVLVGYGSSNGADYWIVRNSWGTGWGEKGYFRIARGKGQCGINTYALSAVIA